MRGMSLPRVAGAVVLCAALVGVGTVPAQADDLSSGSWYYDRGHVQDAHDAGYTGQGVTIAVIDTQIDTDVPTLRKANVEVAPHTPCYAPDGSALPPRSTDPATAAHATDVASLIAGTGAADAAQLPIRGVAPGAKVLFYAVGGSITDDHTFECLDAAGKNQAGAPLAQAIDAAVAAHADIVTISQGTVVDGDITDALVRAYVHGVIVVAALPNDTFAHDADLLWPVGANGVVAVQAFDQDGNIAATDLGWKKTPNTSEHVKIAAPGLGILQQGAGGSWDVQQLRGNTAMSAAVTSGFLAVLKSKYPKATGNQLLQTIIRNTGNSHHEPEWARDFGYGAISLTFMLKDDPRAYPDVNPFFETAHPSGLPLPNLEQLTKAGGSITSPAPSARPSTAATAPAAAQGRDDGAWMPWAIGGAAALVLLVGAGAAILVSASSRRRRQAASAAERSEGATDVAYVDEGVSR